MAGMELVVHRGYRATGLRRYALPRNLDGIDPADRAVNYLAEDTKDSRISQVPINFQLYPPRIFLAHGIAALSTGASTPPFCRVFVQKVRQLFESGL
jgi:hypothetical protein